MTFSRPDPFAFPEVGGAPTPVDCGYDSMPLPPLPLFSTRPPVPPKSGYNMLAQPSLPRLNHPTRPVLPKGKYGQLPMPPMPVYRSRPPPVPPKDPLVMLRGHVCRSMISLRTHLIQSPLQAVAARYPHQPPRPVPAYANVEDLALEPHELLSYTHRSPQGLIKKINSRSQTPADSGGRPWQAWEIVQKQKRPRKKEKEPVRQQKRPRREPLTIIIQETKARRARRLAEESASSEIE
jgi:hypothetical protein